MSDEERQREMWLIRHHAEEALKIAESKRGTMHFGAVNWGDLRVCAVVYCENEDGQQWYRVDIEEANSDDLAVFVTERLSEAGLHKIEVNTEW